jgi:formylglycine-generating enzyme
MNTPFPIHSRSTYSRCNWIRVLLAGTALLGVLTGARLEAQHFPPYESYLGIGLSKDKIAAGVKVSVVIPTSPAAEVGLQVGDVLKAVDGRPVSSADEAVYLLHIHPPYDPHPVKLEIERAGQSLKLEVRPTGFLRLEALTPKQIFFIPGVDTASPFEPKNPVVTLDSINVLKRVLVDPASGTVEFIGTYDPAFDTGPIPYRQLLEDAIRFPEPVFTLKPDEATFKEAEKTAKLMRQDFDRMYGVDGRGGSEKFREDWYGRWNNLILWHPLLEIDRQLFLDKLASEIGMTKSQLVDLYNYLNLGQKTWPVPAAILDGQVKVFEYVGKAQGARAYRLYAQGAAGSLMSAAEALGKAKEAQQLLAEPELAGKSDAERQAILRAYVLSQIARSLGMADDQKAAELFLKSRQRKYPVETFDAWIQGATHLENWSGTWWIASKRVLNGFMLSNELMEAFYGVAPVQVLLTFEGLDGASALGRVLYEADYAGKTIDLTQMLLHTIEGHKSHRELLGDLALKKISFHNQFEPQDVQLMVSANRREIAFGSARIELKSSLDLKSPPDPGGTLNKEEQAAAQKATETWRNQINEGYDRYAQAYPSLHRLREAAKIVALARWMNQQGIKPAPDPTAAAVPGWGTGARAWTPPTRVCGLFENYMEFKELPAQAGVTTFDFKGIRGSVQGGVNFRPNDKWVAILPHPPTYELADDALTTSAALGEAAVQAALSNDLVKARDLAEQSARAMQGEIDIRRLPGNVPIPGRPIPGIAAPNSARLIKETAKIVHALSDGGGVSGGTASISPTQRAMLVDLGGELNKAVSGTPVAKDTLIKLQTRQAAKPAADVKAPSFCEDFRASTANELKPEQKKFYEARLAEVRLDLENICQTMSGVSKSNRQYPSQLEKSERQVAESYRTAQDRVLEAVALMLIDSPSELLRKRHDEMHKTLRDMTMKSIVARKSMVNAEQTAAVDREIFALLQLQLRYDVLYARAAWLRKRLEETKAIYDFNRWTGEERDAFEKLKARLLQLAEMVLNEPALAGKIEVGVVTNETVLRWLSPYRSVAIGADFLRAIVAQQLAWKTVTEELKRSTSQPGPAFEHLRRRAERLQEQIQCLEGVEVAGTARPTFVESPVPAVAPFDAATAAEHQTEWAKYLNKQVEIANTLDMKFRLIPPGEFMMGANEDARSVLQQFDYLSPDKLAAEYPLHKVRITKPFYLGMHEVTLGQFLTFYHDANYKTECERDGKASLGWSSSGEVRRANFRPWGWGFADQTQDHPIVLISWNDAVAFCEWLSRKEGKTYRLPTEAEWEYACKAGTTTRYYFGNDPEEMIRYGNGPDRALRARQPNLTLEKTTTPFPVLHGSDGYVFTSPAGSFKPNSFGLYDMTGNVWEWCGDWHAERYYADSPTDDPQGPADGLKRVIRGGSWNYPPARGRSCARSEAEPEYRQLGLGFRVVLVP